MNLTSSLPAASFHRFEARAPLPAQSRLFTPDATLEGSLRQACAWLTEVAQVRDSAVTGVDTRGMIFNDWRGAMRGEYFTTTRHWEFFCPIWHTGQAIKALVMASRALDDPALLAAAEYSGEFLLRNRVADPADPNHGMLAAYEDLPDGVNTSAVLEALDGLFFLHEATGDSKWREAALAALDWVGRKTYCPGEGLFHDVYHPKSDRFVPHRKEWANRDLRRPLIDDAIFLKGYRLDGNPRFRAIFFETAERLLREETPTGGWMSYHPSNAFAGTLHPRCVYWWGLPMLDAWQESGDERYLECAQRSARWYAQALRRDGSLFRETDRDFRTPGFGHCTSGAACAAIFFQRMIREADGREWEEPLARALSYCARMQLRETADPNLRGVILEKVLPPDGTDRLPYHIRDLGTIFYIQAVAPLLSV